MKYTESQLEQAFIIVQKLIQQQSLLLIRLAKLDEN